MSETPQEWRARRAADNARNGTWGFDPSMPWRVANWRERIGIVVFQAIGWCVVLPAMLIGAIWVLGMMVDGAGRYNAEHHRCMINATNGDEIERCH